LVERYVRERADLRGVVVLVDARRGAESEERELCDWLASLGRPAIVVATKIDRIPKARRLSVATALREALALRHPPLLFSASERLGEGELWQALEDLVATGRLGC